MIFDINHILWLLLVFWLQITIIDRMNNPKPPFHELAPFRRLICNRFTGIVTNFFYTIALYDRNSRQTQGFTSGRVTLFSCDRQSAREKCGAKECTNVILDFWTYQSHFYEGVRPTEQRTVTTDNIAWGCTKLFLRVTWEELD